MSRTYFSQELESLATFWRVFRRDGVALGFVSHNHDLYFDDLLHRSAPGMLPSAIRRTAELDADSLEVEGVLSHDAISETDLRLGRYDYAQIVIGLVDWVNMENTPLMHGEIGKIKIEAGQFQAQIMSSKADLEIDIVPRTSPTCRATFCDQDCRLNPNHFTHLAQIASSDPDIGRITLSNSPPFQDLVRGSLRWIDGPHAGTSMRIVDANNEGIIVDRQLDLNIAIGNRVLLREGCDHTLTTCHSRFTNSVNFQGEPFLPGNDLLSRYPIAPS